MIPAISGPAVLVVDDDGTTRRLVAFALRRAGFEVIEADSGRAAMDAVRTETVGLVVLDMVMPEISGTDVVRALRARAETATLPILLITGSGNDDSVIEGLDAGADDFLPKPVRLDELVARITAHLRRQDAWSHVVENELRSRASVVAALGQIAMSSVPGEAAEAVVRELARRTDSEFVAVMQVGAGGQLNKLATYERAEGVKRGGHALPAVVARSVLAHARAGPWVEEVACVDPGEAVAAFASAQPALSAGAPIYAGDDLVGILTIGILTIGITIEGDRSPVVRRANLPAAAIDFASVLTSRADSAFADRRDVAATRARLRQVLTAHEFHPVFQPIVELATGATVGFEALTRFADGTRPEVRLAEAVEMGMGTDFELATIRAALDGGDRLPRGVFLSINLSPAFVLHGDRRFRQLVRQSTRPLVLELTEHVPIDDYRLVRNALAKLGDVGLAVDDAGPGYASLRHILELRPTYAKLDISLVHGIDRDDLRQSLAAGLQYFALRTGCQLIAEGVEINEEADALERLGIEFAQGFLFGQSSFAA